jgi:hypothetical protein
MSQNNVNMRLLSNAQAALLSGYEKQFHMEPDTDAIIDATEHAARLVRGGDGCVPEWQTVDGERRIVWK